MSSEASQKEEDALSGVGEAGLQAPKTAPSDVRKLSPAKSPSKDSQVADLEEIAL
jgi:hypothetical protein